MGGSTAEGIMKQVSGVTMSPTTPAEILCCKYCVSKAQSRLQCDQRLAQPPGQRSRVVEGLG